MRPYPSPRIITRPDPLLSLPTRRYSCTRVLPRKSVIVDAITEAGARLEAGHRLRVMPDRLLVVEVELRLAGKVVA